MKKVLIAGNNSYVGTSIETWLNKEKSSFHVDILVTITSSWRLCSLKDYDVVCYVFETSLANIKDNLIQYYKENCDVAIEIAQKAKEQGVKQFIFISSSCVFKDITDLSLTVIRPETKPTPNNYVGNVFLQTEKSIDNLKSQTFRISIIRCPMIYGPHYKGDLLLLESLAKKCIIFPAWHNMRSMIYIDNLTEFVKCLIIREEDGYFYPQNKELSDCVEIVRHIAKMHNHKIWISKLFNPFVIICSWFFPQISNIFADYLYIPEMSVYDFDYHKFTFEESLKYVL